MDRAACPTSSPLSVILDPVLSEQAQTALEELGEEVPRGLTDLIRLDGVGPKKAKKLWEAAGARGVRVRVLADVES